MYPFYFLCTMYKVDFKKIRNINIVYFHLTAKRKTREVIYFTDNIFFFNFPCVQLHVISFYTLN